MGSQKKEAILQAKWAVNFVKKSKIINGQRMSFNLAGMVARAMQYCMALATIPAKLLLDLLLSLPIYFVSRVGCFIKKRTCVETIC